MNIPTFKPANVHEWMTDLISFVEEEPRRLFMDRFKVTGSYRPEYGYNQWRLGMLVGKAHIDMPPCNSVGCFAGTMGTRTGLHAHYSAVAMCTDTEVFAKISQCNHAFDQYTPLGTELGQLFWGREPYPFPAALYGTPEYHKEALNNLRVFLSKWEAELKALTLTWD